MRPSQEAARALEAFEATLAESATAEVPRERWAALRRALWALRARVGDNSLGKRLADRGRIAWFRERLG
jgi:hypothetical protein